MLTQQLMQSMGGGPFSPSALDGLKLWLRADLGASVSAWVDQVGDDPTHKNVTQGTPANQPALDATAAGGKPCFKFTGNQSFVGQTWQSGGFPAPLPQPFTVFCIGRATAAGSYFWDTATGTEIAAQAAAAGGFRFYAGGAAYSTPTGVITGFSSIIAVYDSAHTGTRQYVNAATPGASTNDGTASIVSTIIGNVQGFPTTGVDIAEIVVIDHAPSVAEVLQLNTYANTRYGISIGA